MANHEASPPWPQNPLASEELRLMAGPGHRAPGQEPDVVMTSCGDVATQEALAASAILRDRSAAHLKEEMRSAIIDHLNYARTHGTDRPGIADWVWPA